MSESSKTVEAPFKILPPDRVEEIALFGYDRQLKACAGAGLSVFDGSNRKVIVFGYPGVGVRSFPQAVTYYLNKKCGQSFSFVLASCQKLVYDVSESNIGRFLECLQETVKSNCPTVLQLDGIELVSPLSLYVDTFSKVQRSLNYILKILLDLPLSQTLLIATSHNPSLLDPIILQRFTIPIYLEPTSRDTIINILNKRLGRNDASQVADGLASFMKRFRFLVVASELCRAIDEIQRFGEDIKNFSTEKIIDLLTSCISPCASEERLKEYEQANSAFMKLSLERDLPYWIKVFEEKESKLHSPQL